jgi:hypothetical protein
MPFHDWEQVSKEQVFFVLGELKTLFSDRETWIDWPEALDEHGITVEPLDEYARKFSLSGASFKIAASKYPSPLSNFVDCAVRDYLSDMTNEGLIGKLLSYEDEYALICLGYESLMKE